MVARVQGTGFRCGKIDSDESKHQHKKKQSKIGNEYINVYINCGAMCTRARKKLELSKFNETDRPGNRSTYKTLLACVVVDTFVRRGPFWSVSFAVVVSNLGGPARGSRCGARVLHVRPIHTGGRANG